MICQKKRETMYTVCVSESAFKETWNDLPRKRRRCIPCASVKMLLKVLGMICPEKKTMYTVCISENAFKETWNDLPRKRRCIPCVSVKMLSQELGMICPEKEDDVYRVRQ